MRTTVLSLILALALLALSIAPAGATAAMVSISATDITSTRMIDPGFKTFDGDGGGPFPTGMVLSNLGDFFDFDAFLIFTDEDKVNQSEPNPTGDLTPFLITATVTFTAPIATTLTFMGTTVGEEDFSGVPGLDANGNVINQTLVAIWAAGATPEEISLAGGRGVVTWDGPEFVDLGGGEMLQVTLNNTTYNDAVNFEFYSGGGGSDNAGLVTGKVELIPEPSSAFLFLVSSGAFIFRRRR